MNVFLFILFLLLIGIMRATPKVLSKTAKEEGQPFLMVIAIMLGTGFTFILPLLLNWYLVFLFDFSLSYWTAFLTLVVLGVFTETIIVDNENK